MNAPRSNIPDAVRDTQRRASDPAASSFVSANAGSGKTHVLVQRVIRLLLNEVPPEKILCITFTKAAAANMAERVFTRLGRWVALDDTSLDAEIRDAGVARVDAKMRRRARELFARALDTPGGLKVQTIHALCTRLLQQFPFEANVPAGFAVLDERDQTEMMERANLAVLLAASRDPQSAAGRALDIAMASAADVTFKDVVREACLSRDHFMAWTDQAGSDDVAMAQVSTALGVDPNERLEDVEREIVDGPYLPRAEWQATADILDTGSTTDHEQADRLRGASAMVDLTDQTEGYLRFFQDSKLELRAKLINGPLARLHPHLSSLLDREMQRIAMLLEKRRALVIRDRTHALITIATAAAANYRREKQERGLLDYDDLIDKTLAMLERDSAAWMHYKLDRGVDHVLVDEAQDTSPRQWDIITLIVNEFTAGEGARDGVKRTIFAVGDEKQSIFSFQGAVPREFAERRNAMQTKFENAGLKFDPVKLNFSFRSGSAILQSVDHVFRNEEIYRSIHAEGAYPVHVSLADAGPSLIDLWALELPAPRQDIEGWRAHLDAVSETSPEVRLAKRIQAEIKTLIADGTMTGSVGHRRALRYGDILILVRRRGNAFDAVIQALKRGGVPVAGADRLKLTEHIAIIDLMNLADALLLPQDDLALATALKSPLFGLDDDDLFALAWQRKGSLRGALRRQAAGNERYRDVLDRLDRCEHRFAAETPFAFFAWLLGGDGGRARVLKRLGPEANDAIDEFLELALRYERKAPASLQGFMAWLRAADTEVKRDMEISRDEVRVMTVHGAKGLEAPVVFLVDTTTSPSDTTRLKLIRLPQGNAAPRSPGIVVWAAKKADDSPVVAAARAAMLAETEDEYRRLLYVAMTRAADRLVVAGCMPGNVKKLRELSWYDLIAKGLENSGLRMENVPPPDGVVKRYRRPGESFSETAKAAAPDESTPIALPDWLRVKAMPSTLRESFMRPSDPADDERRPAQSALSSETRARARQRGALVHRLLQSLPDISVQRRIDAAARYLIRNTGDTWSNAEREALTTQVLSLIDDPRFASVFAPGSRAEVPVAGYVDRPEQMRTLVSGQIDRMVVTPAEVLIVDYKTNHVPPAVLADTPPSYVRQLALYRAVLAKLYPDRPIRAALLWTEAPDLMEISAAAMDSQMETLSHRNDA